MSIMSLSDIYILKASDALDKQVIVFLGHFNHGKTTLLDALAGTDYCSIEKHGITQTIRTKTVLVNDVRCTIVDTPGQDIFFRMRNYGASVADLVVLVVAADDGICEQTKESIGIADEIDGPVVVCLNKIDKLEQQDTVSDRVNILIKELREYVILDSAEILPISALNKCGLNELRTSIKTIIERRSENLKAIAHLTKKDEDGSSITTATVINTWSSAREGSILHVVIRSGEIKVWLKRYLITTLRVFLHP